MSSLAQRLERVRAQLERRVGPLRHHVGIRSSLTNQLVRPKPCLDPSGLARLERAHGVALPEELAAFLTTICGGGPGPGEGLFVPEGPRTRTARPFYGERDLAHLLDARTRDRYASLPIVEDDEDDDGHWPPGPGFLELAHLGCGMFDAIIVTGELRGQLWCCDMAWRPYECGFLDWYERWLHET